MKYAWIGSHRNEFEVEAMCRVLAISKSGFYAWLKRPLCAGQLRTKALLNPIKSGSTRVARSMAHREFSRICGHRKLRSAKTPWPKSCAKTVFAQRRKKPSCRVQPIPNMSFRLWKIRWLGIFRRILRIENGSRTSRISRRRKAGYFWPAC